MWGWVILSVGCRPSVPPNPVLPDAASVRSAKLVPQLGHRSRVTQLLTSGPYVITTDPEPEVLVWHLDDAVLLHRLRLHTDTVRDLALSPDGRLLATASDDGQVGVWNLDDGTMLQVFEHEKAVETVIFGARGKTVITGAHDGVARIFDVAQGQLVRELPHPGWVFVDRLNDGRLVTSSISEVRIWASDFSRTDLRLAPSDTFQSATVSADGSRIAIQRKSQVTVHDASGRVRGTLDHNAEVTHLAFGPGRRLLTTSLDGTAQVWNTNTLNPITTYRGHEEEVDRAYFSSDGTRVASVGGDYRAHIWDAETGETQAVFGGIDNSLGVPLIVHQVTLREADDTLITGHADGQLWAWDLRTREPVGRLRSRVDLAMSVDASPDGRYLVAAHGPKATLFDLRFGREHAVLEGHQSNIQQVRFAPDGATVFTAASDSGAVAWDAATGEARAAFVGEHQAGLRDLAVAPDGASIVTAGEDGLAVWWDVATQKAKRRLEGHTGDIWAVAMAPDGRRLVTGGEHAEVRLWNLDETQPPRLVTVPHRTSRPPTVLTATFTPDGAEVLIGTIYREILRLDANTGDILQTVKREGPVSTLRFTSDGRDLIAGNFNGVTQRLDPKTLTPRESFARLDSFVLDALAWPDAPWVVSAGMDGTVRFFERGASEAQATLLLAGGGFAVIDRDGRFDAEEAEQNALWVIDGMGYALGQLRDEFYDPGLLAKVLRQTVTPRRTVPELRAIAPPAKVTVEGPRPDGRVRLTAEDRGGGVGEVFATLNDTDVSSVVQTTCGQFDVPCEVDLSELPTWAAGLENTFRVQMSNLAGSVQSRGLLITTKAAGRPPRDPPDLWVLAVGSSDYTGTQLDLAYPALDGHQIASALRLAGLSGFGTERTHIRVLTTDTTLPLFHDTPSRDSLDEAFAWLQQADVLDTVVVFFAGHGVAWSDEQSDDYFFLLPSAASLEDVRDPNLRQLRTWSGDDLAVALSRVPARKRVVILDTCAAGKLDQSLTVERMLSSDALRAHARARHRTGAWVLAGAAADQISYEASRFGQGLLTYSLLEAMKGPALDEGDQLWVSRWFARAEAQVPRYAKAIGGVQRPVLRRGAGDFPLGELPPKDRSRIVLAAVQPVVVRTVVVGPGGRPDRRGIATAVDRVLRRLAPTHNFVWWDVDDAPDATRLSGQYKEARDGLTFEGFVSRGDREQAVALGAPDLDVLAQRLAEQVHAFLQAE
ncbi:MAG: caspase family protein [Myxococcota bacterium]